MEPSKGKRSLKYKSMEEEGEEEEEEEEEDDDVVSGEGFAGDATTLTRKKRPAVASGSSATVAASSTTSTGGSTARRVGSSAGGSTRPSCQADNCSVDLTDSRHYHRRHKICEYHAKATVVTVNGLQQRFCQQCSRFHGLSEFDDNKRSCRRRLAGHNERRRKGSSDLHREGSN